MSFTSLNYFTFLDFKAYSSGVMPLQICNERETSLSMCSYGLITEMNSRRTHPKAQMSTLKVSLPSSCSGGMYLGVPICEALVALVVSIFDETPRSMSLI